MDRKTRTTYNRLQKLARHLSNKKSRGLDQFDFNRITVVAPCGTAGCAVGELPYCFPNHFEVFYFESIGPGRRVGSVVLKGGVPDRLEFIRQSLDAARFFFSLTVPQRGHLFVPGLQCTSYFGGRLLSELATPKAVAKNMRAFCKKLKDGSIILA